MRCATTFTVVLLLSSYLGAQAGSAAPALPQTARQALIEMLVGQGPDHVDKHLPDITRKTLDTLKGDGQNMPGLLSLLSAEATYGKGKIKTFDTGSTFLVIEAPNATGYEKAEIKVERDDLNGNVDEIELVPHLHRGGKEENLPVLLSFVFSMKMEADVWRLNEVRAGVRLPLADPAFLKSLEEGQTRRNEQMAVWSMRSIVNAEKSYQSAQGSFACNLGDMGSAGKNTGGARRTYLWDAQLASGKKNGYTFNIADCDGAHYHALAEPAVPGSGQRAFCTDESGTVRGSADGKSATCLTSGAVVEDKTAGVIVSSQIAGTQPSVGTGSPQRVRISQVVAQGLLVTRVQPTYPPDAREAGIQGTVILKAVISKAGDVDSLQLISGHPTLAPAAMEAVKQWKYKPYLLNGTAVSVETRIRVNFALSAQ
jgi:TonB family protein